MFRRADVKCQVCNHLQRLYSAIFYFVRSFVMFVIDAISDELDEIYSSICNIGLVTTLYVGMNPCVCPNL